MVIVTNDCDTLDSKQCHINGKDEQITYWRLGVGWVKGAIVCDEEFHVINVEGAGELFRGFNGTLCLERELEITDVVPRRPHSGLPHHPLVRPAPRRVLHSPDGLHRPLVRLGRPRQEQPCLNLRDDINLLLNFL